MKRAIVLSGRDVKGKLVSNFFKKLASVGAMPPQGEQLVIPLFLGEELTVEIDVSDLSDDAVQFLKAELESNGIAHSEGVEMES